MYNDLKRDDAVKYDKVKLCYIDEINKTYWDYTPDAKAYRQTEEWKEQDRLRDEKLHRQGFLSGDDDEFGYYANSVLRRGAECQDYPNPDYIPGKQEYYAYFTPIPLDKQWGDDWDDRPYECNAETPYDDYYENDGGKGVRIGIEIIRVPFYFHYDGGWEVKFPKDWGGDNSPFSVQDINAGAVAWIFDRRSKAAINAGCTPYEFFERLDVMNEAHKDDPKYEEDE